MSLIEAIAGTAIRFSVGAGANFLVLPLWGLHPSVGDSLSIALFWSVISAGISRVRGTNTATAG